MELRSINKTGLTNLMAVGLSGLLGLLISFVLLVPFASAATYTVSNTDDAGAGSLRQAILDANANPGADEVIFTVNGTVTVATVLPEITEQININASSPAQAGPNFIINVAFKATGLKFSAGSGHIVQGIGITGNTSTPDCILINGTVDGITIGGSTSPEQGVSVDGCTQGIKADSADNVTIINTQAGLFAANVIGIYIDNSSNITIGGDSGAERVIASNNTSNGLYIKSTATATISGSYFGVSADGASDSGNGGSGITVDTGVTGLTVGGATAAEGNVISGNGEHGLWIKSSGVIVKNNYIGLNAAGTTAIANAVHGISIILNANNVQIGGTGAGNVISGNTGNGIYVKESTGTIITNNIIGASATGIAGGLIQNALNGIQIEEGSTSTQVGGSSGTTANVIVASGGTSGVDISTLAGNYNLVRKNTFQGGTYITLTAPANESLAAPTIATATSSGFTGTTIANGIVDVYQNGTWMAEAVADGTGAFEGHLSLTGGSTLTATVTNASNSTSGTSSGTVITADATPPSTPVAGSPANNAYLNTTTTTITGTKEAYSSIWINGTSLVAVDSSTSWTVAGFALTEGVNTLSIVSKDYSSNSSSTATLTINRDTSIPAIPSLSYPAEIAGGATITGSGTEVGASVYVNGTDSGIDVDGLGNFAVNVTIQIGANSFSITIKDAATNTSGAVVATIAGGGSSHSSPPPPPPSEIVGADEEDEESMAGEAETEVVVEETVVEETVTEETVTDETVVEETVTDETVTDETVTNETESSTEDTTNTSSVAGEATTTSTQTSTPNYGPKPEQTSFLSGIYEFIAPIEEPDLRDNLPAEPAAPSKFASSTPISAEVLGTSNSDGIPELLINLELGGVDPGRDRDSDGDGLTDYEEIMYGGNPYVSDADGDGRTDFEEVWFDGTNPENFDTDGDMIPDTEDLQPLVYDAPTASSIELTDYISENVIQTPLGLTDSDEDGISDLYEIYIGTDPQDDDSDADGISDGVEVLQYGTNPNAVTTASEAEALQVVNMDDGDTMEAGRQFIMGHGNANETIKVSEIGTDGTLNLIGENTSDENGSFAIYTNKELPAGSHTLVLTSGEDEITDISGTFKLNTVEYVDKPQYASFGTNESVVTEQRPLLSLKSTATYMMVAVWQSTVYSQTLIADAAGETVDFIPNEDLENGNHTVTYYSVDLGTDQKSAPTQIEFSVANTAFATGTTGSSSPWIIVLGSIAALSSLTALALFFRGRRPSEV